MRSGAVVAEFERAFAQYVGAKYAIALCNGTATLHTALVALGVKPGDKVAVPPLTMSATTIAVLQAGAVPVFRDVRPDTWLIKPLPEDDVVLPVELYGLTINNGSFNYRDGKPRRFLYDGAQTLKRPAEYEGKLIGSFRSFSFQASKILSTGEGGMLVTDDEALATKAREFSSLGYRMRADQPRIDPAVLKSPTFDRHHSLGFNYRMNDVTAAEGLKQLADADALLSVRQIAANLYRAAIAGCDWITPQYVPDGWTHDYWTYAVACDTPGQAIALSDAIVVYGGERPYPAWRLTYHEPAFSYLWTDALSQRMYPGGAICPVAESLQPRLLQFQTNSIEAAEKNAHALRKAIGGLGIQRLVQDISDSLDIPERLRRYRASHDSDATGIPCG